MLIWTVIYCRYTYAYFYIGDALQAKFFKGCIKYFIPVKSPIFPFPQVWYTSVVQLVRTSYIMRVIMSSSPNWSEHFLIFHITYDSRWDYRGMAKWFGAHYNQEVRFSSAVKCKKEPQVLTSLLNQRRNYYFTIVIVRRIPKLPKGPIN